MAAFDLGVPLDWMWAGLSLAHKAVPSMVMVKGLGVDSCGDGLQMRGLEGLMVGSD